MTKYYLVFLDILGFDELPKEIANKTGFNEEVIRQKYFFEPVNDVINIICKESEKNIISISEIGGSDSYILLINNFQDLFLTLRRLLSIKISHIDYNFIPFEIAIDVKDIHIDDNISLINKNEIIEFLKNDIISNYKNFYKGKNKRSIKSSFVVVTKSFFNDLNYFDKEKCSNIIDNLYYNINVNYILDRGKFIEFLTLIGKKNSGIYDYLNEIYVKPNGFDNIVKKLENEKIIFITGSPEYGKTYTAAYLLWKYFQKGCNPIWFSGEEKNDRYEIRKKMNDIEMILKEKSIIYFEDAFGRFIYEPNELLERKIGDIIDNIKNFQDVYIIITSREEVFKKLEKGRKVNLDIKKIKNIINIKNHSYNYNKKLNILLNWAKAKKCRWLNNENKYMIYNLLNNNTILPSPLSIKSFVMATINITDIKEIKKIMDNKSIDVFEEFSIELNNMSNDKLIFLFLTFIEELQIKQIKKIYNNVIKKYQIKNPLNFDAMIDWFIDDIIDIKKNKLIFSHSTYYKSFEFLLKNKTNIILNNIIDYIIKKIFNDSIYSKKIGNFIATNYELLPIKSQKIIKIIKNTASICPSCLTVLPAFIFVNNNEVYMRKKCEQHGNFIELLWDDYSEYSRMEKIILKLRKENDFKITNIKGCPLDCGLCKNHKSSTKNAIIDVTNRCDLKCPICFAHANAAGYLYEPSKKQITQMIENYTSKNLPPLTLQLSGGEPTQRKDLLEIVETAKKFGITNISIVTNGKKMASDIEYCKKLQKAGVNTINLAFDGLNSEIYLTVRGENLLLVKENLINNFRYIGFENVILTCMIVGENNDDQLGDILNYALKNNDVIKALVFQIVSITGKMEQIQRRILRLSISEVIHLIQKQTNDLIKNTDWFPMSSIMPIAKYLDKITNTTLSDNIPNSDCYIGTIIIDDKYPISFTKYFKVDLLNEININDFYNNKNITKFLLPNTYINDNPEIFKKRLFVVITNYMDPYNFDVARLQRCTTHYLVPDGRIIPFCSMNNLHRSKVERKYAKKLE
jgi:hypothetical protein